MKVFKSTLPRYVIARGILGYICGFAVALVCSHFFEMRLRDFAVMLAVIISVPTVIGLVSYYRQSDKTQNDT
jgi:hypothetical protein